MANDQMHWHVESSRATDALQTALAQAVRDVTKLRAEVVFATPGSLANDGKVIEDARTYQ